MKMKSDIFLSVKENAFTTLPEKGDMYVGRSEYEDEHFYALEYDGDFCFNSIKDTDHNWESETDVRAMVFQICKDNLEGFNYEDNNLVVTLWKMTVDESDEMYGIRHEDVKTYRFNFYEDI